VLLLLFSFSFFGFDEIVQPLSSCQSDKETDKEEQAGQEEDWRKWEEREGKGREGKGREGREEGEGREGECLSV
jgi:hypothetical protein